MADGESDEKAYCCGKKTLQSILELLLVVWIVGSPIVTIIIGIAGYMDVQVAVNYIHLFDSKEPTMVRFVSIVVWALIATADVIFVAIVVVETYRKIKRPVVIGIGRLALLFKRCS